MSRRVERPLRKEIWEAMKQPPPAERVPRKYHYKEAYVKAEPLGINPIRVERISDGIAILRAIGQGKLMISTRPRPKDGSWYDMAECDIRELAGKTEEQIIASFDRKTDAVLEKEAKRRWGPEDRPQKK